MTENPSTRNIYMPIAFAAGVLVGGAGALLLRPKVSTWRSTFNANRVARTARKKEFAAVKEIYDAYKADPLHSPFPPGLYKSDIQNKKLKATYPWPRNPQDLEKFEEIWCKNAGDTAFEYRAMYNREHDAKETERNRRKDMQEKEEKRKGEVERGEMKARVWRGGFLG